MSDHQPDIAPIGTAVANWSIKAFSVEMRDQINRAARQADCTVAEWLHGHFVRFGIAGQKFDPVKLDQDYPAIPADGTPSAAVETAILIRSIRELVGITGIPRRLRASAVDALAMQLRRLEGPDRAGGDFPQITGS